MILNLYSDLKIELDKLVEENQRLVTCETSLIDLKGKMSQLEDEKLSLKSQNENLLKELE